MTVIWIMLATAALFGIYALVGRRCDCSGTRCAGCPLSESDDES